MSSVLNFPFCTFHSPLEFMIYLTEEHIKEIEAHGERTFPFECGGMIIGRFENDKKTVVELLPMENAMDASEQHNRVLILPKDVLRAERFARQKKLDVIGYYHSHPDCEAVPSQFDLDHALPVWSYIIVSVESGKAADIRSWKMENDRSKFNEEEIKQEIKELFTDAFSR